MPITGIMSLILIKLEILISNVYGHYVSILVEMLRVQFQAVVHKMYNTPPPLYVLMAFFYSS